MVFNFGCTWKSFGEIYKTLMAGSHPQKLWFIGLGYSQIGILKWLSLFGSPNFFFFPLASALYSLIWWYTYAQWNHLTSNLMGPLKLLPLLFCFQVCLFIYPPLLSFFLLILQFVWTAWLQVLGHYYFPW